MHKTAHPLRSAPANLWHRDRFPCNARLSPALRNGDDRAPLEVIESELARSPQVAQLEAILFLVEEPIPARKLASFLHTETSEVKNLIEELRELYDRGGSAFQIEELAGGYQLLTRAELHHWLARARGPSSDMKLSGAAKETLAIVAYRQPITRAEIEQIRGVQCSDVLRQLMERGLIRITGRETSLGRPVLYGTTKRFLQWLGLKQIRDLPRWKELT